MITEKQTQKIIREAPASGKKAIELRDDGERGAGRLTLVIKPRAGRVTAEFYAVYYLRGKRAKTKLGSDPTRSIAQARRKFPKDYAPAASAGQDPTAPRRPPA